MDEDEIDLIDLFVVLLRYRWLIILCVLFSLVAAGAGYLWVPQYRYAKALEEAKAEVSMTVVPGPVFTLFSTRVSLPAVYTRAELLYSALRGAGYDTLELAEDLSVSLRDPQQRSKVLFYLQQRFVENKGLDGETLKEDARLFKVVSAADSDAVRIVVYDLDSSKAKAFLEELHSEVSSYVSAIMVPSAQAAVRAYERLLTQEVGGETNASALAQNAERYDTALRFLDDELPPLIRLGGVQTFQPQIRIAEMRDDFKLLAVGIVAGMFFFSVLLAFVLNAVAQARKDPQVMQKIHAALNKNNQRSDGQH